MYFKSLPNNKFLDWAKFKAFADENFTVAEMKISVINMIEHIVGKGGNAGYQHFLLFPLNFFFHKLPPEGC